MAHKTPVNRKEYMRKYMQDKRADVNKNVNKSSVNTKSVNWQDIDPSKFDGHGNGVPVNGFVRVIRKVRATLDHDYGVVTEPDFRERLSVTCPHGLEGWSCKVCL